MSGPGSIASSRSGKVRSKVPKKGWRRTVYIYKMAFFDMLFAMMKEDGGWHWLEWIVIFITFLQDLAFCFIQFRWGAIGDKVVGAYISVTQIERAFLAAEVDPNDHYILAYTSIGLIAILFSFAVYVMYSFVTKDFKAGVWPLRVLRMMHTILASILYLPVVTSLGAFGVCKNGEPGKTTRNYVLDPEHYSSETSKGVCWKGFHLTTVILCFFALSAFIPFAVFMSLAYFEPDPDSPAVNARPHPWAEIIELISKTIVVFVFVFGANVPIFRALFIFFCYGFLSLLLFFSLPYHKRITNLVRGIINVLLFWGAAVSVPVAIYDSHSAGNILFWVWLGGNVFVVIAAYYIFQYVWKRTISPEVYLNIIEEAKATDPENWKRVVADQVPGGRFAWSLAGVVRIAHFDRSEQAMDICETILQCGIEKFPTSSYLLQTYGMFLKLRKNDYTLSMLYFQRASDQPYVFFFIQFIIYQAERDRRERLMALEQGAHNKMDAVDRVEYKQLLKSAVAHHQEFLKTLSSFWKSIALHKASRPYLLMLVERMQSSERSAIRYYEQLYSRFGHIPKVLEFYANFLDVISKVDESEAIRKDLRQLLEDTATDDAAAMALSETRSKKGTVVSRRMTISSVQTAPPAPIRSPTEKKAHHIYRRLITDIQDDEKRTLSLRMFLYILANLVIFVGGSIGYEIVGNYTSSYMSQIVSAASMGSEAASVAVQCWNLSKILYTRGSDYNNVNISTFRQSILTSVNLIDSSFDQVFYPNNSANWVVDVFTSPVWSASIFNGINAQNMYSSTNFTIAEYVNEFKYRAKMVASIKYDEFVTPNQITFKSSIYGRINATLPGSYLMNPDWRFIVDNTVWLGSALNFVTDALVQGNEVGITYLQIASGAVLGVALIMNSIIALVVFAPAVSRANRDRQLAIEAFLQLPHEVVLEQFMKYRYTSPLEKEIDVGDEGDDQSINSNESDEEDQQNNMIVIQSKSSVFGQIRTLCFTTYFIIIGYFFFYTTLALSLINETRAVGRKCQRASQVPFLSLILSTAGSYMTFPSVFAQFPPAIVGWYGRGIGSQILYYQRGLLFGNETLGITSGDISLEAARDFFFSRQYGQNNQQSLFDITELYLDSYNIFSYLPAQSSSNAYYRNIEFLGPLIAEKYLEYAKILLNNYNSLSERNTVILSYVILPIFVLVLMLAYIRLIRKVLSMIAQENERTLRITLMLPIALVGEIESIKKMLKLDQNDDIPELSMIMDGSKSTQLGSANMASTDNVKQNEKQSKNTNNDSSSDKTEGSTPSSLSSESLGESNHSTSENGDETPGGNVQFENKTESIGKFTSDGVFNESHAIPTIKPPLRSLGNQTKRISPESAIDINLSSNTGISLVEKASIGTSRFGAIPPLRLPQIYGLNQGIQPNSAKEESGSLSAIASSVSSNTTPLLPRRSILTSRRISDAGIGRKDSSESIQGSRLIRQTGHAGQTTTQTFEGAQQSLLIPTSKVVAFSAPNIAELPFQTSKDTKAETQMTRRGIGRKQIATIVPDDVKSDS